MEGFDLSNIPGIVTLLTLIALGLWQQQRERQKTNNRIDALVVANREREKQIEGRAQTIIQDIAQKSQERIEELTDKLNAQAQQIITLMQDREKMRKFLEKRIATLDEQIKEKDVQIAQIKDEANTREQTLTERVRALEARVEEMAKALTVKDNTIKALQGENEKLKIAAERHKAREGQWAVDRKKMEARIKGIETERNNLKARLEAQETRIEKLETSTGTIPVVSESSETKEETTTDETSSD